MDSKLGSRWLGGVALTWLALGSAVPAGAQEVVDMPAEDRALRSDFEEVFRIGSIDGEVWETFGDVASTAFDGDGNLYVLDRQSNRIVKVDRGGDFVAEIGSPGEGPGEFRMAMRFTVLRDGRLVVADLGHRSYQIFGVDGEFERMVSMATDGGMMRLDEIMPHADGEGLISGGGLGAISMRGGTGAAPDEAQTRPIEYVSLTGDVVSTRVIAEGWQPPRGDPMSIEGGGLSFRTSIASPRVFEPQLLVGALPDGGVIFSDSSAYALKVVTADGAVSRVLRRPFFPEPTTEEIEEAERERRLEELEVGGGPQMRIMVSGGGGGGASPIGGDQMREIMENQIAQMQFYPELPVITNVRTSWTGKVWVQRRGDEPTLEGPIDVLTSAGQYMGTFDTGVTEIPSSFGPDGLAAYVELDEFDVPTVVVRKLPPVLN